MVPVEPEGSFRSLLLDVERGIDIAISEGKLNAALVTLLIPSRKTDATIESIKLEVSKILAEKNFTETNLCILGIALKLGIQIKLSTEVAQSILKIVEKQHKIPLLDMPNICAGLLIASKGVLTAEEGNGYAERLRMRFDDGSQLYKGALFEYLSSLSGADVSTEKVSAWAKKIDIEGAPIEEIILYLTFVQRGLMAKSQNYEDAIHRIVVLNTEQLDVLSKIQLRTFLRNFLLNYPLLQQVGDINVRIIRNILENFHIAVRKVIERRKDKPPFALLDEYDLQDILYVVLKSAFIHAKFEDPVPKNADKSTRIDFTLPDLKMSIELKYVTEKNVRDIGDQIKIDIQSYSASPFGDVLFFYVYDPNHLISDPHNLIKELEGEQMKGGKHFRVFVVIKPL